VIVWQEAMGRLRLCFLSTIPNSSILASLFLGDIPELIDDVVMTEMREPNFSAATTSSTISDMSPKNRPFRRLAYIISF
jgi:hypothetical protein